MPGAVNEKQWNKAKTLAAKENKPKNYAYIMGIYKKLVKKASTLDAAARTHIKRKNFGIPRKADNKKEKKQSGNYPIYDEPHARAAMAYGKRFLSSDAYAKLKSRVRAKFPGMEIKGSEKKASAKIKIPLTIKKADGSELTKVAAELASTPEAKVKGLGGREMIKEGEGMLFPDSVAFWMKDVPFDLDLIGMDRTGKIMDIKKMAAADKIPAPLLRTYVLDPPDKIACALEVPAGWCEKNNVTVGDFVEVKL